MKVVENKEKRLFHGSKTDPSPIADCGRIYLEPNEQVTFINESGKEYDFCAKSWGFYATPSVNKRLCDQGFKTALVGNPMGKLFVMVVSKEALQDFNSYLNQESCQVIEWLDQRKLMESKK